MEKPDISTLTSDFLVKKTEEITAPQLNNLTHIVGHNEYYDIAIQFRKNGNKAECIVISAEEKNKDLPYIKIYSDGLGKIEMKQTAFIDINDNKDITKSVAIAQKTILAVQSFYYEEIISKYETKY